jgi:hypothetical protein
MKLVPFPFRFPKNEVFWETKGTWFFQPNFEKGKRKGKQKGIGPTKWSQNLVFKPNFGKGKGLPKFVFWEWEEH